MDISWAEMLATLPVEMLEALRDAAFELDVKQAHLVLGKTAVTAPKPVDALHRLVGDFDFGTLKRLLNSVISGKTKNA